jgi:predicted metal-dependent phosphoesterase TrpH
MRSSGSRKAVCSMRIDLHMHSTASDGVLAPFELVRFAAANGIELMAIADHDSVDGVEEAQKADAGISVVAAVELSADVDEMHILGYGIDAANERLNEELARLKSYRNERNPKIIRKLQQLGMNISMQDLEKKMHHGSVGRPHIARILVQKGYVQNIREAFLLYLGSHGKAYVNRKKLPPEKCIDLIHAAGGISVLAHPCTLGLSANALGAYVRELRDMGLKGLEVYHFKQHPNTHEYLDIAKKNGLLVSGGSDYHSGNELYAVDTDVQEGLTRMVSLLLAYTNK